MPLSIEIDPEDLERGLRELEVRLDAEMKSAAGEAAGMVAREAALIAPRRTGELSRSIEAATPTGTHSAGTLEASVQSELEYATPVHDGARAHTIRARNASMLRFTAGGQVRFASQVRHPGQRPQPFLDTAADNRAADIERLFSDGLEAAVRRAGFL